MLNTLSFYRGLKNHEQIRVGQYDGLYFLMVKCGHHQELSFAIKWQALFIVAAIIEQDNLTIFTLPFKSSGR